MKAYRSFGILFSAALLLAACGGDVKETLGLNRQAPDEFRVVSRPPLSVPPEFNLRPPGQGSEFSIGVPAQDQAHQLVTGDASSPSPGLTSPSSNSVSLLHAADAIMPTQATAVPVPTVGAGQLPSNSDAQFLHDAGAGKTDPHVRQKILDEEGSPPTSSTPYLLGGSTSGDSLVDPMKETQRLKQDKAQNQPPTTGDTPVVAPDNRGLLGGIF